MAVTSETFRIPRRCINDTDPLMVNHAGKKISAEVNAADFFSECPPAFVNAVLNSQGGWNQEYHSELGVMSLPLDILDTQLDAVFEPIYTGANGSLDKIYTHGFNKHDPVHIKRVKRGTRRLLQLSGASELQERLGLIAASGHDVGNPWSREVHSLVSPRIVERVLPELKMPENAKIWRTVRRAMQLHNEPVAAWLIKSWEKEGCTTENQIIERMRADFGVETLALIIADKTDIGRHRISDKPKDLGAVDEDRHLEVNLLGKTVDLELSENKDGKKVFRWNLEFTPGLAEDEEVGRFARQKRCGELVPDKVQVSNATHTIHQEFGISHFDSWKQLFWSLYADRIHLTIRSAFALYTDLSCFEIHVSDDGEEYTQRFTRINLGAEIELVKTKHLPKLDRKK